MIMICKLLNQTEWKAGALCRRAVTHSLVQEVHVVIYRTDRPSDVLIVVLVLFYHRISLLPNNEMACHLYFNDC